MAMVILSESVQKFSVSRKQDLKKKKILFLFFFISMYHQTSFSRNLVTIHESFTAEYYMLVTGDTRHLTCDIGFFFGGGGFGFVWYWYYLLYTLTDSVSVISRIFKEILH